MTSTEASPDQSRNTDSDLAASPVAGPAHVLYISYNGMLDPLGQSQVLPYLRGLAKKGIRFTLLSFERSAAFTPAGVSRCRQIREELRREGIEWHWRRYHSRPTLPATVFDVLAGFLQALRLNRQARFDLVHARSHIPATIALLLKRWCGTRMIFDIRGLMAEEYVDARHWQQDSFVYRITKAMERRILAAADGIVTLTEQIWPIIQGWKGLQGRQVQHEVVPCCVRLDLFNFRPEHRWQRRAELDLENRLVLVYSGSIGGWYLDDEMAEFFAAFANARPDAHFLWLTPGSSGRINELMSSHRINHDRYSVIAATPQDVSSYLSAADVGLSFIKPCFSKLASSPTKYAEYLACGLPLVINSGIGDSDALVNEEKAGVLVSEFTEAEYDKAIAIIEGLLAEAETTRRHNRQVAERCFDLGAIGVERYTRLYRAILEDRN